MFSFQHLDKYLELLFVASDCLMNSTIFW